MADTGVPGSERCVFVGEAVYGELVYDGGLGDSRCRFAGGGPGSAMPLAEVAETGDCTGGYGE